jgi:hypothetical protein
MAIRYYNIKSKPGVFGFAIKVNTEDKKRTIEDISASYSFKQISIDKKYSHFEMYEGDNIILRDNSSDSGKIGAHPIITKRGSEEPVARICLDNFGNIRLYQKKENQLLKEISKEEAINLQKDTQNWKLMQSWI